MNWIEIIIVRLSKQEDIPSIEEVFREVGAGRDESADEFVDVALYRNKDVESDWAIHLRRQSSNVRPDKSGLGRMIAEAFRPFGLVHHSVWESR
ncbi:MAG: hypothetical protein GY866_39925 [Proteobacteria bacterium]|nr:hypothetical protein [Pseudomonadota bacterium]